MATPRRRHQPQRGYKATRDTVLEAARWYLGTWMPSGSDRGATVDRQPPPQSDSGEGGVLYEAGNAARVANAGGRGEIGPVCAGRQLTSNIRRSYGLIICLLLSFVGIPSAQDILERAVWEGVVRGESNAEKWVLGVWFFFFDRQGRVNGNP